MAITLFDLAVDFAIKILTFVILMPLLQAYLAYRGLKALGVPEPEPTAESPDKAEGAAPVKQRWAPPEPLSMTLCTKVFCAAMCTTYLLMIGISWLPFGGRAAAHPVVGTALATLLDGAVAIVLLRRFTRTAIAVVAGVSVLGNVLAWGAYCLLVWLVLGRAPL